MKSYNIKELVSNLVGNVYPIGESNEDCKRFENLEELKELLDYFIDEIYEVSQQVNRPEYSVCKAGKSARDYLYGLRNDLNDMLDN